MFYYLEDFFSNARKIKLFNFWTWKISKFSYTCIFFLNFVENCMVRLFMFCISGQLMFFSVKFGDRKHWRRKSSPHNVKFQMTIPFQWYILLFGVFIDTVRPLLNAITPLTYTTTESMLSCWKTDELKQSHKSCIDLFEIYPDFEFLWQNVSKYYILHNNPESLD